MRVAVLTSGRQDWGILRSTCLLMREDPRFELRLFVGGMHCVDQFGRTERLIADEGFDAADRLDWITPSPTPTGQAGLAVEVVGAALSRHRPDALVVVGDRSETLAAALAATLERVPIVHLHGGEETAGAFDNSLRNAVTKLSHLHLVSHPDHAARVIAMGEQPETVHVVGAPGLDNLHRRDLPTRADLERELRTPLRAPVVLVTVHPTTLGNDTALDEVAAVAMAMDRVPATYVITLPNNDPGAETIRASLMAAASADQRIAVEALGDRRYWGMLHVADAILGNSSSALIEAPAVGLPAVNVGDRQQGRLRGDNVVDVPDSDVDSIATALREALKPAYRRKLAGLTSPYGDGRSARRIIDILADWTPPHPPRKAAIPISRESS